MGIRETIATLQAAGPTLTAAAAATCLNPQAKQLIQGGKLGYIGRGLHIKASGQISSVITTPGTARFDIRYGGTVIFDSQAILLDTVAAHTNVGWYLDILLTMRIVGSSAQAMGQGIFTCEDILGVPATASKGVLSAMLPWNTAPALGTAFDETANGVLDMFFTQTVATGSMTVQQYEVDLISPYND